VTEPLFWLGLSLFFVALSLTAVLIAAYPAFQELARAARSAEKLFDTLHREFPPTLEAVRLTGLEISELTDDLNEGVKSASDVVKQVDRSFIGATQQVGRLRGGSHRLLNGVQAAWQAWQASGEASPSGRSPLGTSSDSEKGSAKSHSSLRMR
jgi:hypothetical protein